MPRLDERANRVFCSTVASSATLARTVLAAILLASHLAAQSKTPPNDGRGAGSVPLWNPCLEGPGNEPIVVRVLVLNYDPIVPSENGERLSRVFGWSDPARLATEFIDAMEYATGGYLNYEIVDWRNRDEIYAQENGLRYSIEEYVANRRKGSGWRENGAMADYPKLLSGENVDLAIDSGRIDEVWIFSDHYFGVWEASMAGPRAFFVNGGVYPDFPSRHPFVFYGFNYERGVAEMMHDVAHQTEATMNRIYGGCNFETPTSPWDRFSANHEQSNGKAGVGTCHWPANATHDYDYGNTRTVLSWADTFLNYPDLDWRVRPVSRDTWSTGGDPHLDYMKWYFAHIPRAEGSGADGRQNNWFKYIYDFDQYDAKGLALAPRASVFAPDVEDKDAGHHSIWVTFESAAYPDPSTFDANDITVITPQGESLAVVCDPQTKRPYRTRHVVEYRVKPPTAGWNSVGAGDIAILLSERSVKTRAGEPFANSQLGVFRCSSTIGIRGPEATQTPVEPKTTLFVEFEGNVKSKPERRPTEQRKIAFESGKTGRGLLATASTSLAYPTKNVIPSQAGTIEFWVQPKWSGKSQSNHVFLEAGRSRDNSLVIQVDGNHHLRFLVWGDDPQTEDVESDVERGLGVSVESWEPGEWHHVAAMWGDAGRTLELWLDGISVGARSDGVALQELSTPSFRFGAKLDSSDPADAVLDELRISSGRRVQTAIAAGRSNDSESKSSSARDNLRILSPRTVLQRGERMFVRASFTVDRVSRDVTRIAEWTVTDSSVLASLGEGEFECMKPGQVQIRARFGPSTAESAFTIIKDESPSARLIACESQSVGAETPVRFSVELVSQRGWGSRVTEFGDVWVRHVDGSIRFASIETVKAPSKTTRIAHYRVDPPGKLWSDRDRGALSIEIAPFRIRDAEGHYACRQTIGLSTISAPRR